MIHRKRRAFALQILFLFVIFAVAAASRANSPGCCLCGCPGSSCLQNTSSYTEDTIQANGELVREHHIVLDNDLLTLTPKDLDYFRSLASTGFVIGLQVPTAPGATEPGQLVGDEHRLEGTINIREIPGSQIDAAVDIPLESSSSMASQVASVFPAEPNTHWQALVPGNMDYLSLIPGDTSFLLGGYGVLRYTLDFGGDLCLGCIVKMTMCTNADVPWLDAQLANQVMVRETGAAVLQVKDLTCIEPFPTAIRVVAGATGDAACPSAEDQAAWLSPEGGPIYNATHGPAVEMQYFLGLSRPESGEEENKEFTLEPVASEQGWIYGWFDAADNPLTEITVTPGLCEGADLKVKSIDIPTCTVVLDTIHLTATSVTSPVIQATAVSYVHVSPDLDKCPVSDLGVTKIGSPGAISAGGSVNFTLTISNYTDAPIGAVLTDTLSPVSAIEDATLPAGCSRSGGEITCQVTSVATDTPTILNFVVQVAETFSGTLSDIAAVQPVGATDPWFYDNHAGPVAVQVIGPLGHRVHLPVVLKGR
jgi:hypothetical protein